MEDSTRMRNGKMLYELRNDMRPQSIEMIPFHELPWTHQLDWEDTAVKFIEYLRRTKQVTTP